MEERNNLVDDSGEGLFGRRGDMGTVIRVNPKTAEAEAGELEWGLLHHSATNVDQAPRPIWARAEVVQTNTLFADAFQRRRGLVVAKHYYQRSFGEHRGKRFEVSRRDHQPMFWAGLWESLRVGSDIVRTYCVITVEASADITPIHDRMPLVLEGYELQTWLGQVPGNATVLLRKPAPGFLARRLARES